MPATLADTISPSIAARRTQAFPTLDAGEIDRIRAFATPCRFAAGERVYETGKPTVGLVLVLSGAIRITARDGHGHDLPMVEHGVGSFAGEIGQLARRRSHVDGVAVGDVAGLLIDSDHLQTLLV